MAFTLSKRDESRLLGLDDALAKIVRRAAELTDHSFLVVDGLITAERMAVLADREEEHAKIKALTTGRAVRIVPIVGGKNCWKRESFESLVSAMKLAADEIGVSLRWHVESRTFEMTSKAK